MDEIDEILLALRDYRSDELSSDEPENVLIRSFFYNLGTANNLANITKEEFLEADFIDEIFAARDRLRCKLTVIRGSVAQRQWAVSGLESPLAIT